MEVIETLIPSNLKKTKDKKQIVLAHTSRNIFDYVTSLKLRFNGDPIKLPHYLVSRDGKVIRTIDDLTNSNFTINKVVNEKSIVICLENLGWLEKVLLKHKIKLKFIGHNTKVKGVESFLGIITKSNFDDFVTDLSPAFDFEKFNKLLNYE